MYILRPNSNSDAWKYDQGGSVAISPAFTPNLSPPDSKTFEVLVDQHHTIRDISTKDGIYSSQIMQISFHFLQVSGSCWYPSISTLPTRGFSVVYRPKMSSDWGKFLWIPLARNRTLDAVSLTNEVRIQVSIWSPIIEQTIRLKIVAGRKGQLFGQLSN